MGWRRRFGFDQELEFVEQQQKLLSYRLADEESRREMREEWVARSRRSYWWELILLAIVLGALIGVFLSGYD